MAADVRPAIPAYRSSPKRDRGKPSTATGSSAIRFRSCFKDWATDWAPSPAEIVDAAKRGELVEAFPRDLVEVALAHALDSEVEEAHRRTEMIEERRRVMSRWVDWCSRPATAGDVVPSHRERGEAWPKARR